MWRIVGVKYYFSVRDNEEHETNVFYCDIFVEGTEDMVLSEKTFLLLKFWFAVYLLCICALNDNTQRIFFLFCSYLIRVQWKWEIGRWKNQSFLIALHCNI